MGNTIACCQVALFSNTLGLCFQGISKCVSFFFFLVQTVAWISFKTGKISESSLISQVFASYLTI